MSVRRVAALLVVAGLIGGCSTRPREFAPTLAVPPADQAAFVQTYDSCKTQVAEGKRDSFKGGRGASAAMGAGTVLGAGAAGTAVAGWGGVAIASGGILLAPIAIWGGSRMIRAHKEKEIKQAMATCLSENGYEVADWEAVKRRRETAEPPKA